ncbi:MULTISPECIES: hypothetical protein [Lactobacillaceae]|uniref:hypothetical protein n=1 Tax=Lactobacillaceae TaxID=33958 RepID=UPI0014564A6A|nr:hypothetical protein [Lactobacillus sp. HBUAS51381]NLR09756.1 hypothetical protein [Lactobacillus sp. HBUAS51381]
MNDLTRRLRLLALQQVGLLWLSLALGVGGLWLQGPAVLLKFHRYVTGDFQMTNLPPIGLGLLLLPGIFLLPLIRRWASLEACVWQAWTQVVGVSLLNMVYGLALLMVLNVLAPLPREYAIMVAPLATSMTGAILEAGGGLCFWLVAVGVSQLWLSRTHPWVAQGCPVSLIPLLPLIAGLSTRMHSHPSPVTATVMAIAPVVVVLLPGGVFGLIVSYVNRVGQREFLKKLAVAGVQQKNRRISKDVTV